MFKPYLTENIRKIAQDFLSLIYPELCLLCSLGLARGEELLCTHCHYALVETDCHLKEDNALHKRLELLFPLKYALAFLSLRKSNRVEKLIYALKYRGRKEVGYIMGKWYGQILRQSPLSQEIDLILPIPLHPKKLKIRGYNQSTQFGMGLSEVLGVAMLEGVLIRQSHTQTQTRKNRIERWKNVANVFRVQNEAMIKGKHILLVDDVITTGATLGAAAKLLLKEDIQDISVGSIAMAQLN